MNIYIRKCDKCGVEAKYTYGQPLKWLSLHLRYNNQDWTYKSEQFDLCPECAVEYGFIKIGTECKQDITQTKTERLLKDLADEIVNEVSKRIG